MFVACHQTYFTILSSHYILYGYYINLHFPKKKKALIDVAYFLNICCYIKLQMIPMLLPPHKLESRDSSVGIALGYGLDDRGSRVRFPAGAGNFSLHYRV
jgi:hypothetical protein